MTMPEKTSPNMLFQFSSHLKFTGCSKSKRPINYFWRHCWQNKSMIWYAEGKKIKTLQSIWNHSLCFEMTILNWNAHSGLFLTPLNPSESLRVTLGILYKFVMSTSDHLHAQWKSNLLSLNVYLHEKKC